MNKISNVSKNEPINLFNNIGIETAAKCNRHCYFCPNDYFKRPDEFMSTVMFDKIISNLKSLKYKGRVELYIYNEPTRDARLIAFIKQVRQELPSTCIMINTNGDYFKSSKDILDYFDAGLNQLQINIYSAQDGSDNIKVFDTGVKLAEKRTQQMLNWVNELTDIRQDITLYQNIGAHKKACKVVKKFGIKRTTKSKDIEGVGYLSNRSGNIPDFNDSLQEPLKKYCTRPFRFLNINWRGDSILCCNDYYGETNFGNVNEKSLEQIWNDVNFNIYRLKLQNQDRKIFLCDKCDFNGGYYPHMINKVTFGDEQDKEIINMDLSERDVVFGEAKPTIERLLN